MSKADKIVKCEINRKKFVSVTEGWCHMTRVIFNSVLLTIPWRYFRLVSGR